MLNDVTCGDALELIEFLPTNYVDAIITSPPYWKQRTKDIVGYIGNETTLDYYIEHILGFFVKAHRVLKDEGTVWINLGEKFMDRKLSGLPWRTAFALEEVGYTIRDCIIWDKMNKCFGGVSGRTTLCHEYIFLLSKSGKNYYFDNEAIKEKGVIPAGTRGAKGSRERYSTKGVNSRPPKYWDYTGYRNKRSVWHVKPKPSKLEHYSMFPVELIEPCVIAGSPQDGIILDPFGGLATTGISALRNDRNFICFELDEKDVIKSKLRLELEREKFRTKNT